MLRRYGQQISLGATREFNSREVAQRQKNNVISGFIRSLVFNTSTLAPPECGRNGDSLARQLDIIIIIIIIINNNHFVMRPLNARALQLFTVKVTVKHWETKKYRTRNKMTIS